VAREDGEFLALWYWPTKPKRLRNGPDAMRARYVNSLARTWEPDRMYKGHDRLDCGKFSVRIVDAENEVEGRSSNSARISNGKEDFHTSRATLSF
jgi:hypothetical protein